MSYKRVLLKLSGEQFGGEAGSGIDSDFINQLAADIKRLIEQTGVQLAIMPGGGNFARGRDLKVKNLEAETSHYMGMMATVLNGLALRDVLRAHGIKADVQSLLEIEDVARKLDPQTGQQKLNDGEVLIVLAGTGRPFVTTDTGSVEAAVKLECQVVLKATKVDGVYDKDPLKHAAARKYDFLTHAEASTHPEINVMDKEAHQLAHSHRLPVIVLELSGSNLLKAVRGETVGTMVG